MPIIQQAGDGGLLFTNSSIQIVPFPHTTWWLADGAIPASNVLEHVENPGVAATYTGGTAVAASNPWTVVAKGVGYTPSATSRYIFDTQSGRFILGISDASNYGFYNGSAWTNSAIFPDTNTHIWFAVASGSEIQAYLDSVATGSSSSSTVGIHVSGTTRWKRSYDNVGATWANAITRGAVYNIALDATQRLALYASMLNS